ncbi:Scr1 family TA system antitoxin-like transcriptional regulator [Streptomyces albus]
MPLLGRPAPWHVDRSVRPSTVPYRGDGTAAEPPTVYADGCTGSLYPGKPEDVARYDAAFTDIRKRSLDEDASRRPISEVAEDYVQR